MNVGQKVLGTIAGIVLATTLAGCGDSTAGEPTPAPTTDNSSSEETSESEEPAAPADLTFSNGELCELLTPEEAGQLGSEPQGEPGYSFTGGHPQCSWTGDMGLVVGFQEQARAENAPTGPSITNTETTIAGRPAMQSLDTDPIEICQVLVDINDKAVLGVSATVLSSGQSKNYVPCDVANQFAEIVIPKALDR